MPTLTDRRHRLTQARTYETNRLTLLQRERRQVCGCTRCGDGDRGTELDALITRSAQLVAGYSNQITDRK